MIRSLLFLVLFYLQSISLLAQEEPFQYFSRNIDDIFRQMDKDKNWEKMVSIESQVEKGKTVSYSGKEHIYRVHNNNGHILEEGKVGPKGVDMVCKTGKWKKYNNDGGLILSCSYYKDIPVGEWIEYYSDGQLKKCCYYTMVDVRSTFNKASYLSGEYKEYYKNGQLKTIGIYGINVDSLIDTFLVVDPVEGTEELRIKKVLEPYSEKLDTWRYYSETGELIKEE